MSHPNGHRNTITWVERYIGTPYDDIKEILSIKKELLELLTFFRSYSVIDAKLQVPFPNALQVWVIPHNMGKFPSIETVDLAKEEMVGEVVHIDNNNLEVRFNAPVSGWAYLN